MWKNNLEFNDPKNQKNWFLQLVYSFSKHLLSSYYVPMLGKELWWRSQESPRKQVYAFQITIFLAKS